MCYILSPQILTGEFKMAMVRYYATELEHMTPNQKICSEGRFGLYRNLLKLFGELSFHELALRLLQYKEHNREPMIVEEELGYCLLRLVEEGLVGMKNVGPCKKECCSLDNVSTELEEAL